jgi:poly(3-hydroxyalkanoate) synthetase
MYSVKLCRYGASLIDTPNAWCGLSRSGMKSKRLIYMLTYIMVSKKKRFSECRLVIDSWGQENREIPKAMHGRHLKQILIQTKLNRPAIVANSGERDYR